MHALVCVCVLGGSYMHALVCVCVRWELHACTRVCVCVCVLGGSCVSCLLCLSADHPEPEYDLRVT